MSRFSVVLPLLTTVVLVVAYGVHRWLLIRHRDQIRAQVGGDQPVDERWARTDPLLERVPGLGILARRARLARLPLGITDLVLTALAIGYVLLRALEYLLGPTVALPLTLLVVPWGMWLVVDALARRRQGRIITQIPDVVRLLAGGAKAGLSLTGSLTQAAAEVGEPIAAELRRLVTAVEFGRPLDEALADFGKRVESRDLDIVISAIGIQQRTGGDLVALLSKLAVGLETTRRARREVRSITAGLSAQAYIGVVLGFGGVVLVNRITDGGVERAMQLPVAAVIFGVSGVLLLTTVPVVRRIVRLPS